jgi:hypothetical protein
LDSLLPLQDIVEPFELLLVLCLVVAEHVQLITTRNFQALRCRFSLQYFAGHRGAL